MTYPDPVLTWDDAALARQIRDWAARTRPDAAALYWICHEFELDELADELIAELAQPRHGQYGEQTTLDGAPDS